MNQTIHWHAPYNTYEYNVFLLNLIEEVTNYIKSLYNRVKDYTKETVEHFILACLLYILICILLYILIIKWNLINFEKDVKNKNRVLVIIAHPDDECMFFGPTILNLTKKNGNHVYILCLSTGNSAGLGKIRKDELYKSCSALGIKTSSITVYNHTLLPDSMDVKWPIEIVSKLIINHIEQYGINAVVTFDKYGISQHQNHCSIYYAIAYLILEKKLPQDCSVYVLETINVLRKYWLFLDIPITYLLSRTRYMLSFYERKIVQNAMRQHKSQLLWFRRLYMPFSRYMLINSLQEMRLSDIELDLQIDED